MSFWPHRRSCVGRVVAADVIERLRPHLPAGFDFATVRIRDGVPRWAAGKPSAVTFGDTIYFAPGRYAPATEEGLCLLAHELAHVAQFRRLGVWRFALRYLGAYFAARVRGHGRHAAYWNIPLECAAREVQVVVAEAARSTVG